ncbi:MAG: sulfatase [Isosphaeraceae bacterium]
MVAVSLVVGMVGLADEAPRTPNVLMIAVDDLNDWVGCLGGHPQARTPRIDALAQRGTVFTNAHCQAPLCNPSRTSLLFGLRPSTTGVYGLAPAPRTVALLKDRVTLPQHFSRNGYSTFVAGKIFHDGVVKPEDRLNEFDAWGNLSGMPLPKQKFVHTPDDIRAMDWGVFPERDEGQADWKIASSAIDHLAKLPKDKPFFMAVGFRLPHVPCFASQRWFDLFPEAQLTLPPVKDDDRSDVPHFAWYLHWKLPEPRLSWLRKSEQWRPLVRAYLASTAFMDSQVGRVLDALEASGRAKDTVVVLWSDHGWHLGEKGITGKNTLWERSTRVPLIAAGPGVAPGARCAEPAELLDLYPTLAELCRLPAPAGVEGHSLTPQLRDASAAREWPAITTHNPGNHAVRTREWRFIRYADGSEELYNLRDDPNEWTNRVNEPGLQGLKQDLARWIPKNDAPHAPGSASRVLMKVGNGWTWEGQPIRDEELER